MDNYMDENESWKGIFHSTRIDYNWLHYNPSTFLPLDFDTFFKTGYIRKVDLELAAAPSDWSPVFLTGCGRSGMTLLGKILSFHREIFFLNEPLELWMQEYPDFDIVSCRAMQRAGKLKKHEDRPCKLNDLFYTFSRILQRPVCIEKTPEHSFKLKWLARKFPNSKFILMKRNPIQVARSISRFQPLTWYGYDDYKWKQLVMEYQRYRKILNIPEEFFERAREKEGTLYRAFVEWALSILNIEEFKIKNSHLEHRVFEIHYEDLISDPTNTLMNMIKFIGLTPTPEVFEHAQEIIKVSDASGEFNMFVNEIDQQSEASLLEIAGPEFRSFIYDQLRHGYDLSK